MVLSLLVVINRIAIKQQHYGVLRWLSQLDIHLWEQLRPVIRLPDVTQQWHRPTSIGLARCFTQMELLQTDAINLIAIPEHLFGAAQ
jgi:hypothetical protein